MQNMFSKDLEVFYLNKAALLVKLNRINEAQ